MKIYYYTQTNVMKITLNEEFLNTAGAKCEKKPIFCQIIYFR